MKAAYVDTSCLVSIGFAEPGSTALKKKLGRFDRLFSANLLEAELHSAMVRERVVPTPDLTAAISWIMPDRPLHGEIAQVLAAGYVRGADCWHLAAALFLAEGASAISFLTLDERQGSVARTLGFRE